MADQPMGGTERRKKLFINRALQGRLIALLALFAVLISVLFIILEMTGGARVGPQSAVSLLVKVVLVLIAVLIGVVYVGLRYSQRIAGPIYHFGRQLTDIVHGDYSNTLHFRKNDEFQNVAVAFNHAMDSLRGRVNEDIDFYKKLIAEIENLSGADSGKKDALIAMLKNYSDKKGHHLSGS
jgi:methyl-accepting chemotaxis protein